MFRNYLKTAIRNLFRNKLFSLINIVGLAIGMATIILIVQYIANELQYDNFHANGDRIYRLIINEENTTEIGYTDLITAAVAVSVAEEFPEVETMLRFSYPEAGYISYEDKTIYDESVTYADSTLFSIMSFELIYGDPKTCLTEPWSVILTKEMSDKIFGKKNPVGEVVTFNGDTQMKVTGVVKDLPENSSIQFNVVISFVTLYNMPEQYLGWDGGWRYTAYVMLGKENYPEDLQDRLEPFMEKNINYKYRQHGFLLKLIFQPFNEVHLYSGPDYGLEGEGRLTNIYVLSSIALLILLIACFNFMNLSTARAARRAREVGIRKVSGATRRMITRQFLIESVFISLISLGLALALVELFQPVFNRIVNKDLHLLNHSGVFIIVMVLILVVLTGFVAGSYPAFFMSRFQVVKVLKGNILQKFGKPVFRNILVAIQFLISTILIFSTIIIQSQINFMKNTPLGYNTEDVAVIPLTTENAQKNYKLLKEIILQVPGVKACGASTGIPGLGLTMNGYLPDGLENPIMIHVIDVDDDYLNVMGIPVVQGEGFSPESGLDSANVLINQSLAKQLGWESPVGKNILRGIDMKVIGVVDDFHFAPLTENIGPLIITQNPWDSYYNLSVNIPEMNMNQSIEQIQSTWEELLPDEPFEYFQLEEFTKDAYQETSGLRHIFFYFTLLAILVACLGLLGLSLYTAGQRSKEVGVRKVFGASISQITLKLSIDFLKWVLLGSIIAFPIAWWAMDTWLQNFAYRIDFSFMVIVYTLFITIGLSLLTIIFQIIQLARSNPANILKEQ